MGAGKQTKGRVGGQQRRQATPAVPERQGQPATSRASPPPPARDTRPCSGAARVQPRGCKGRSPLHKKTKNLPLPRRGRALCERGAGGIGAESKLKAGAAGDKQGKPPTGDSGGKVSRQPAGQAPRRARGSPLSTVPPGAPLQPNHAGITCCFGDNITKIP